MANKKTLLTSLAAAIYENLTRDISATDVSGRFIDLIDNVPFVMTANELRAEDAGSTNKLIYISDLAINAFFLYDSLDTTSPDDGANVLVDTVGKRYKKIAIGGPTKPEYTIAAPSGSFNIAAGDDVIALRVISLGAATPLFIGLSAGTSEIVDNPDATIGAAVPTPFPIFFQSAGSQTFHVSGITSTVKITVIKL